MPTDPPDYLQAGKSLQDETRQRLQERKRLFTLRELESQIGVTNGMLHKFLSGKTVHPPTLRKIIAWLDTQASDQVNELDKALTQQLEGIDEELFAYVRGEVWRTVRFGLRRSKKPVPAWMKLIPRSMMPPELDQREREAPKHKRSPTKKAKSGGGK